MPTLLTILRGPIPAVLSLALLLTVGFASAQSQTQTQTQTQKPAANLSGKAQAEQQFPDVIDVKVRMVGKDRFDFDVTLSSPYDTPKRYADAFRVMAGDKQLGERVLLHDHQNEQPFTRDLYGVNIAPGIQQVRVQGRDQKYGYGGKTMDVKLPGR
jgi:hypothetical protein